MAKDWFRSGLGKMPFPVEEDVIGATEAALDRRLPAVLRVRLGRNNGGEIIAAGDDWQLHPVRDNTDRKRLARTANHIVYETGVAQNWPGFPDGGVAIAANGTGDRLVLLPGSDAIFLWNHESGATTPVDIK